MTRHASAPARRRHGDVRVAQLPQSQTVPVRPADRFLILLVGVALGCYLNTLRGALIYDDVNAIVRNPAVTGVDLVRIATTGSWFSPNGYMDVYRPVTTATFAANYAVHGVAPFGYHLVNVALHAAVCVVLALVLARITGDATLALLAAFLFAAHPVHTEAVASVVGRAELLAALLGLLAWWIVLARRSMPARAAAALVLLAAALAKENAITIVAVAIAADLIYRRRFDPGGYGALALGGVAALLIRTTVMHAIAPLPLYIDNPLGAAPAGTRLSTALAIIAAYARLLVWPVHLSADYSFPQLELATSLADPRAVAGLAVL